jgi:peptidoglycan/xylan/chitin deacetylase (PgdA/CDA1 family)
MMRLASALPSLAGRLFPDLVYRIPTQERVLYLTFDDGPTRELTAPLLDLLARFEAPATFFLIGAHAVAHPHLVRATVQAGHTIGNHSYTHPDPWHTPSATLLAELERTTGVLEDLIAQPLRWMRPPYGRLTWPLRHWCRTRRQHLTLWDVVPGDWLPRVTTRRIEQFVLRHVRPGSIVVLHDNPRTADKLPAALHTLLTILHAEGWRFAAL